MDEPFNFRTASTANAAKCSFSEVRSFEERVVLAIFNKSNLNYFSSFELSYAIWYNFFNAASLAFLHPAMICYGCIFYSNNFSPIFNNSPANTATVVVPSPTSSS